MIITEVKKAKDFSQSNKDVELFDNLSLSTRTRNFILKKYGYYCSFNEILKEGRNFAFDQEMGEKLPKWAKELVSALTEEGFIRPAEEFLTSFRVNSLYRAIVKDDGKEFVTSVRELTNEEYEEYDQSFNEVNVLKEAIGYYLTERELKVLCLRFGIEDGIIRDLDYVSEYFGITQMRVRQIEAKALRKLRRHT